MLEEALRAQFLRPSEEFVERDNLLIHRRSVDAEPIIQAVQSIGSMQPVRRDRLGRKLLASVDPITATNWARESGTRVGTREFIEYAKKKLMSGDYSKFVVNRPRTYV